MALAASLSDFEKIRSFKIPSLDTENSLSDSNSSNPLQMWGIDRVDDKHMAALKLQKVYKSFRTRRKLADCAVLVEQSWWKLLDFAELKKSSISFFDIEKHESAISRWSRARTRAAKVLYVGKKKKGAFHHSSFLAGGATTAAGRLVVDNGTLKALWPHSGHYRPTEENFKDFVSFLQENDVDLKDVQLNPVREEDDLLSKQRSNLHVKNNSYDKDLTQTLGDTEIKETEETIQPDLAGQEETTLKPNTPRRFNHGRSLPNLEIPNREKLFERLDSGKRDQDQQVFLKRINLRKGTISYQLGEQLSCKWATGAGPRIGCIRDYPAELQFQAIQKVFGFKF